MLEKTRGIILHQIKYTDSGIIAQLYTRNFGRQSFIIKGMRNRRSGKHNILFQPMFILDLEINYKASREMNFMKEFSVSYSPYDIYSDIKKSSVAIFLGEVLTSVLKEESPHEEMFDYIEKSIIYFDRCKESYANFHIAFLYRSYPSTSSGRTVWNKKLFIPFVVSLSNHIEHFYQFIIES